MTWHLSKSCYFTDFSSNNMSNDCTTTVQNNLSRLFIHHRCAALYLCFTFLEWNEQCSSSLTAAIKGMSALCDFFCGSAAGVYRKITVRPWHITMLTPPCSILTRCFTQARSLLAVREISQLSPPTPQCLNYVCDNVCGATGAVLPLHLALHYIWTRNGQFLWNINIHIHHFHNWQSTRSTSFTF